MSDISALALLAGTPPPPPPPPPPPSAAAAAASGQPEGGGKPQGAPGRRALGHRALDGDVLEPDLLTATAHEIETLDAERAHARSLLVRAACGVDLRAECQRRPVLLVLEDLHWGDAASVAFVEVALRELAALPFIVIALARPELHAEFPRLWSDARLSALTLLAQALLGETAA